MVADVSGLVNMLATQPAQDMELLGAKIRDTQKVIRNREQQEFENQMATTKQALETKLANQEISLNELEMVGKRGGLIAQTAQSMLQSPDPIMRQEIFRTAAPALMEAGVTSEQIRDGLINIGDTQYWKALQARGVGANEYWKTTTTSSASPSAAYKKKTELIAAGVDPTAAEAIGYGTIKQVTDPNTGDIHLVDMRNPGVYLSPQMQAQIEPHLPKKDGGEYSVKPLIKGTKIEKERAINVTALSDDLQKTGAPRLENILNRIETAIGPAIDVKGEVVGDIPGYGATAVAPDWAISREGQDLRQDLIKLFNIELAERSGAAVTKQELDRLRDEFKAGMFKTDRQLVQGIRSYRSLLEDYKKAVFAGYTDDVIQQYWEGGGLNYKSMKEPKTPTKPESPTMQEMPPAAGNEGKVLIDDETNKQYKSNGAEWIEVTE